jgi:hypothetical protein
MATKTVEMAKRDPANAQRFVSEATEVEVIKVSIRNRDRRPAGRILNDVISGQVKFRPGQVKTLEVSQALATELKARKDPSWELVPRKGGDDDEEA